VNLSHDRQQTGRVPPKKLRSLFLSVTLAYSVGSAFYLRRLPSFALLSKIYSVVEQLNSFSLLSMMCHRHFILWSIA